MFRNAKRIAISAALAVIGLLLIISAINGKFVFGDTELSDQVILIFTAISMILIIIAGFASLSIYF